MKQQKKILVIILLIIMLVLIIGQKVLASDEQNNLYMQDYTDEFKEWLELSDEEKEKVIMPRMYEVEPSVSSSHSNLLFLAKAIKASVNQRFSLQDVIPENVTIRNQQSTNSCWAFATLSSLETNLALYNYRNSINLSKIYSFSERHLEYATSQSFINNQINKDGYNREVGSGGNYSYSHAYLTNGSGAILESEMPFENNEDDIDISQIEGKTVSSEVYDTTLFPNYNSLTGTQRDEVINQIKQHIQNYGSVEVAIHGNSSETVGYSCYNNETGAKYCNNTIQHPIDHAVSIIGWDDNYSVDNFAEDSRPSADGAWIARNSWGERIEANLLDIKTSIYNQAIEQGVQTWTSPEEVPDSLIESMGYTIEGDIAYVKYGDNGIIYISYEDVNVGKQMAGIVKASDTVNYDHIYQYDKLYPNISIRATTSSVMLSNIFKKQSSGSEYLNEVMIYAPIEQTCKVYVNPNGTSTSARDLQLVQLKSGESESMEVGYHTLEFAKTVKIVGNEFVVVVEIQSNSNNAVIGLEGQSDETPQWSTAEVETGKCFMAFGNDLNNCTWIDLGKIQNQYPSLANGDSTIKAFTTNQLYDESLNSIEIATPPNKTTYFEGENFDKTGMVIRANYNSRTNPSVILDDASYSIENGSNLKAGQTDVTITYEDKSVKQPITVEKNSVTKLEITTQPSKVEYYEGESFDSTGMVIEATYKDGSIKVIDDYTIEDGYNLKNGQTQVTITYDDITIYQAISVIPNSLLSIKITKEPNKTNYVVGQDFDKTGMIVTGNFENGANYEIVEYTIENGTNLVLGQTAVIINYEGMTVEQPITVEEKAATGISISKNPSKMQYIQNKDELDLSGGILTITYNDNTSETLDLESNLIQVTGFDNSKLGRNVITLTYLSQTTTLEIEIVAEESQDDGGSTNTDERPENSDFSNSILNINKAQFYTFSDSYESNYLVIDVTISGIDRNIEANDSYEYYYYLSPDANQSNIQDWIKINENQLSQDKLEFTINTNDVKNLAELEDAERIYVFIREVAIKGGNQSVVVSVPLYVDSSDIDVEVYLDNERVYESELDDNDKEDQTTAPGKLPQTGVRNFVIIILLVLVVGGAIFFIRYKKLSKYVK